MVGPLGECSKDMHALIKVLGETKVAARARARGRQASDNELGVVISQIRKYLSISFIRAQILCLHNSLERFQISRKRDLQAHHQAHIRVQGPSRAGLIFVP